MGTRMEHPQQTIFLTKTGGQQLGSGHCQKKSSSNNPVNLPQYSKLNSTCVSIGHYLYSNRGQDDRCINDVKENFFFSSLLHKTNRFRVTVCLSSNRDLKH